MAELDKQGVTIVWLKRDLRLRDHAPLYYAAQHNEAVILLYCWEPILLRHPNMDSRHWGFVSQSLTALDQQLPNSTRVLQLNMEVVDALKFINQKYRVTRIRSHQEIGLEVTHNRDKAVKHWAMANNVGFDEAAHGGVIRGLPHRKKWQKNWETVFSTRPFDVDLALITWCSWWQCSALTECEYYYPVPAKNKHMQVGGEPRGWHLLHHFFKQRGIRYAADISKPLDARHSCTRLSPYIAWGNLSIRQVYQFVLWQKERLDVADNKHRKQWRKSLNALISRLHWHCHFIQKFESEHAMEWRPVNKAYAQFPYIDGPEAERRFVLWCRGMTGYPLVDACMRALSVTGYLNFRMRAMVTSFLCHHLNVHWLKAAHYLASQFLDFEPGIHYPQIQMQASVTGVHTVRLYSPHSQSKRLDPESKFIKKWVPELADLPNDACHEPWSLGPLEAMMFNFDVTRDYVAPIIDIRVHGRDTAKRLWDYKQRDDVLNEAKRIVNRHTLSNSPSRQWVKQNS